MKLPKLLNEELQAEAQRSQKILAQVPEDKLNWKPHDKNMTLHDLAVHVANLLELIPPIVNAKEFDLLNIPRSKVASNQELLNYFDATLAKATKALNNVTQESLEEEWTMKAHGNVIATLPRYWQIRTWVFNHIIHHRAQLGMYLRLLDVNVPGTYGPSADEPMK